MKYLVAILLLASTARADMAFIAAPRTTGLFPTQSLSEQRGPYVSYAAAQLILRNDNGVEKVLVPDHVLDFSVSLDGKSILYTKVIEPPGSDIWAVPMTGKADIFRLDLASGASVQLTKDTGWNCRPVELGNGEIAYLANRDAWMNPHETYCAFTIWKMNHDGSDKQRIWHAGLGGCFGLSVAPNGRILFSSGENQGFRGGLGNNWSIWSINPDGSSFEPEFTGIYADDVVDWPVQTSEKTLLFLHYYDTRVYGTIMACPLFVGIPHGPPSQFGSPIGPENEPIHDGFFGNVGGSPWQRRGTFNLTYLGTHFDNENVKVVAGVAIQQGMYSHPWPIPGNGAYVTWTGDQGDAKMNLGVYAIPDVSIPVTDNAQMVKVVDLPDRHEWMGKPVVPFAAVYGSDPPTPTCPKVASLPVGSPFGVIGTSAVDVNEWIVMSEWATTRVVMPEDSAEYVRIIGFNPTMNARVEGATKVMNGGTGPPELSNYEGLISEINERLGVYDQLIPLKKWKKPDGALYMGPTPPAGSTRILRADGKPDTSWSCEVPANQPWSLQLLDAKKQCITGSMAQTWHQVNSREQRTNCSGCHAHWKPDQTQFEETEAAKETYPRLSLRTVKRVVYQRDIQPLGLNIPIRPWKPATGETYHATYNSQADSAWRSSFTPAQAELVAQWQDTGFLANSGVPGAEADTMPPTLIVEPGFVGAHDPDSGLKSVTVNGTAVTLAANGVAALPALPEAAATFEAIDKAGNKTTRTLTPLVVTPPPPIPRAPGGQYVGMTTDELGKIRSQTPDGQLDHHIKLTGLDDKRKIAFIDIKAGTDADQTDIWHKWSTDAGEESPAHPAGLWWWIKQTPKIADGPAGALDIWFSKATPTQEFSEYRVYVVYDRNNISDRDFIPVVAPLQPPPPIDPCAAEKAALQAEIDKLKADIATLKAKLIEIADQIKALGQINKPKTIALSDQLRELAKP